MEQKIERQALVELVATVLSPTEVLPIWKMQDILWPTLATVSLVKLTVVTGQLISECLFDVLNFPKTQRKNLINFCPRI
jgi:hypothetical protein